MLLISPIIKLIVLLLYVLGAAGGPVRISCSGDNSKPPTIAEEAVDQLQENEKLVAGMKKNTILNFREIDVGKFSVCF